jgi:hypothetical protein
LPILPSIFLRKGIMEPALPGVFDCPPQLDHPPSIQFGFGDKANVKEGLTSCFHAELFEFQSYSTHRNHFDIDSKKTCSKEIQVISMERFSEVMKTFCFAFGEKYEVTLGWSKRFKI